MTRILVVDDEPAILEAVGYAFAAEGWEVDGRPDGEQALQALDETPFDLVVLDLMLPGVDGSEVCRRIRADNAVPIIMLTAKSGETDRVLGLEIGADDYVSKPFSMAELVGRVRAILRRQRLDREQATTVRQIGDLTLDVTRHVVTVAGESRQLTPSEFRLLHLLAEQPGRVYTRREIMQHLWDSSYVGDQRACDIHISNLRRKLDDDANQQRIVTVRGVGYKLESGVS